jgi:hypothetical protein
MKIDHSRAAVHRYELRRADEDHRLDPVVPENYGLVHAVLFNPAWSNEFARQTDTWFDRFGREAACGVTVKVIFPMVFDTNESEACARCVKWAILRQTDPEEYRRLKA